MNKSQSILSEITIFSKYAKYLPSKQRRETWEEICLRYEQTMLGKYREEIVPIYDYFCTAMRLVREKKVLPSMRFMQFAGPAIEKNESRGYNCAYLPIDHYKAFSETMFLLLGGTGVGFSVQRRHVDLLPRLVSPGPPIKYLIGDSIEGWADAVKALMKAYLKGGPLPVFDYSDIRHKGATLITAGGKAPGPDPLRGCLVEIKKILDKAEGKLTSVECHDIQCHIANAVLAGGIRRAAMISLFDHDDQAMLECKSGEWWILNEQRGRSNNSVVLDRDEITKEEFDALWKTIKGSGSGEPGIYFTNDYDLGTNPCCEISLKANQFCNLTEVNVSDVVSQEDLNERVDAAALLGTLQAGFTNFHYLRNTWKETTEEDALIGVGMTGIASGKVLDLDLKEAARHVRATNFLVSDAIGINAAARLTTVKPSGTTSLVLGTSSGIHAWHGEYYLRSIRVGKSEALYTYLAIHHPELIEDDEFRPTSMAVIRIPQEAPNGAIMRDESALNLLNRVSLFNQEWVREGHRKGLNTNNVSATISISDRLVGGVDEWTIVREWMWDNRHLFNGLSVLPFDNGTYVQAPFEEIDKETHDRLSSSLTNVDLTKVIEIDDETSHGQEAACAGGACNI